jgi:hypothetical protein
MWYDMEKGSLWGWQNGGREREEKGRKEIRRKNDMVAP